MGVYYKNCEFARDASYTLTQDRFGLGSLTRTYRGRDDKLQEFLKKWPAGKADEVLPTFKLTDINASGSGAFTTVTLSFVGLLNGELPKPVISGGWSTQTTNLTKLEGDQTVEIQYRAPTSRYEYISKTMPKEQKYAGKLLMDTQPWEITNLRGDRGTRFHEVKIIRRSFGTISYTRTLPGRFNYARDISTSVFEFEKVGDYWRVTEQIEGIIIDVERNDLPRFMYADHYSGANVGG